MRFLVKVILVVQIIIFCGLVEVLTMPTLVYGDEQSPVVNNWRWAWLWMQTGLDFDVPRDGSTYHTAC